MLTTAVWIYPDREGYVLVADWAGGGRAAARVKTVTRKKVFHVPEEISALFSKSLDEEPVIKEP